jgi:hypothetical protein
MSELKAQSNDRQSDMHRTAYGFDFASNDGQFRLFELVPDKHLAFDPFVITYGRMAVRVDDLRWDDVLIRHDLSEVPATDIEEWFDRWFGPEDRQTGMIHCLSLQPGVISTDMGTAPEDAFHDLLGLLEGAKSVQLNASRAEAED